MLKPFGHVISTRILRDANGLSRGVGFARYAQGSRMHSRLCVSDLIYTAGLDARFVGSILFD